MEAGQLPPGHRGVDVVFVVIAEMVARQEGQPPAEAAAAGAVMVGKGLHTGAMGQIGAEGEELER